MQQSQKPTLRNPDKVQPLPWRDWMREHLPIGPDGMVIEDLDLVSLLFGSRIGRRYNDDGRFSLIEIKQATGIIQYAQKRLFGLIHRVLRRGDPDRTFYRGFYILRWVSGPEIEVECPTCHGEGKCKINEPGYPESINGIAVPTRDFVNFMLEKKNIPSMFDD